MAVPGRIYSPVDDESWETLRSAYRDKRRYDSASWEEKWMTKPTSYTSSVVTGHIDGKSMIESMLATRRAIEGFGRIEVRPFEDDWQDPLAWLTEDDIGSGVEAKAAVAAPELSEDDLASLTVAGTW